VINIFDSAFESLGKFDFVFSRNMLIYFDKETKQRAKNILQSMRKNEKYEVFFGHADLF
jgi:chemotaxis protein methyltransferase CheR